ncbi:MAG: hypothetical protein FWD82_10015, partial [Defluviitaleaceae bacterium]|nr:hypothetical protein [Defluviitaleaceae bacterium]
MERIDINGVEVFIEEAENYIQVNDISESDLTKVWGHLIKQYPEYEVNFCFRNVTIPIDILSDIGAEILDDCIKMQLTSNDYIFCESYEVEQLKKEDFASFAAFHDKAYPEMYWTSTRLLDKWDNWRIFVTKNGDKIIGYTLLLIAMKDKLMGEIFCVAADNFAHHKALLSVSVNYAFENGKNIVIYMTDRDNTLEQDSALAVGFKNVGFYKAFRA